MNTVDVLRGAKEILSDPNRWEREKGFSRTVGGLSTVSTDPAATTWCAFGAIERASGSSDSFSDAYEALKSQITDDSMFHWNDKVATHEELIDTFDRAILSLAPEAKPEPTPEQVTA